MTAKFLQCIVEATAKGEISPQTAAEARETYEEAVAAIGGALSPEDADREAGRAVLTALEKRKVEDKRLKALAMRSRRNIVEGVAALKGRRGYEDVAPLGKRPKSGEIAGGWVQGGRPPAQGPGSRGAVFARSLELLVENKPGLAGAPFASIEGRYRAFRGQLDAMMAQAIEAFETKTGFDAPGRATLSNVVRELHGETSGDAAAAAIAEGFRTASEYARKAFNAAGGDIGKMEGWALPQTHDPIAMRAGARNPAELAASKAAWIDDVIPRLARDRMIDKVAGQPFTDKRLRVVLGRTFDRITTAGMVDRDPSAGLGRGMLARQRREERFLIFRSADDWLAYQAQFGTGDAFGVMLHHLDEMSRDIAQMQILGPNPQRQFEWLEAAAIREAAREEAAGVKGALERAQTYARTARNMLDHFTGAANTPERAWLSELGATSRSYITGVALASSIISDVPSSPVFGAFARAFSGLSRTGDVKALFDHLASPEVRAHARRSGFIVEQATDGLVHGAQDSLRLMTTGTKVDGRGFNAFARRLPAATMRLSGQTVWSQARKRVFRFEFMGKLADVAGRTLDELKAGDGEDRALAELMEARGLTAADWDKVRSAQPWEPKAGARFLRPSEISAAAGEDLALRVAEMIEMQSRLAVPETTLWTRAKLLGGGRNDRPGTAAGEFKRTWAMFRSFSMTATYLYAEEIALRGARTAHPGLYMATTGAGLLAGLTLAGGVSIYLRELVKGNDPKPVDNAKFWGAAVMQGGGLGILGDFFYSNQARTGKSSTMTAWGPTAAWASDTYDLTLGNLFGMAGAMGDGEDLGEAAKKVAAGRDAARYLAKYSPVSSLWWARTAWDRDVADQLQRALDPDAADAFDRQTARLEHDGQGQWWPEGQALPERAPNLAQVTAPAQ